MSIDGPGIVASDLAHDVYNQIFDLYDAGVPIDEIRKNVTSFEAGISDNLDLEVYLAASAKAFWEIGYLQASLRGRLCHLVESGKSLALWAQAGGMPLANARKAALYRLLKQIESPRIKPRSRKKYPKIKKKLYSVGDCIELATKSDIYRGIVCKVIEYRGKCEYTVLVMGPSTVSTIESYASGCYYGRQIPKRSGGYILGPHVIRPEHGLLLRAANPFRIIGHLDIDEIKFILGISRGFLTYQISSKILNGLRRIKANNYFPLKIYFINKINKAPL